MEPPAQPPAREEARGRTPGTASEARAGRPGAEPPAQPPAREEARGRAPGTASDPWLLWFAQDQGGPWTPWTPQLPPDPHTDGVWCGIGVALV